MEKMVKIFKDIEKNRNVYVLFFLLHDLEIYSCIYSIA
jgi:hypothetical protein